MKSLCFLLLLLLPAAAALAQQPTYDLSCDNVARFLIVGTGGQLPGATHAAGLRLPRLLRPQGGCRGPLPADP